MWQEVPKRYCHTGVSLQSLDCFHHSKRSFEAVSWIPSWKVHFCSLSTFCPKQLQTDLCLNSLNQLMVELWARCLLSPVTLCWACQRKGLCWLFQGVPSPRGKADLGFLCCPFPLIVQGANSKLPHVICGWKHIWRGRRQQGRAMCQLLQAFVRD